MAEKRMISKVISISKKFNKMLNNHFTRLLYLLLIPHSDDFGRLTGCPDKLKALIIPMMGDTEEDVERALIELHNAGLIIWYESNEEKYVQINNFEDHQQGLHKRTRSKFPEPPSNSGKFPEIPPEEKRTEENRTEEEDKESSAEIVHDDHKDSIPVMCRRIFGYPAPPSVTGYIDRLTNEGYTEFFIKELLLEVSESSNKPIPKFLITIGDRWKRDKVNSRHQAKQEKDKKAGLVYISPSEKEATLQQQRAEERKNADRAPIDLTPEFNAFKEVAAAYDTGAKPTGTI